MLLRRIALLLFLTGSGTTLFAQLGAPNASGVSLGHVHLMVPDPEEHKLAFLTDPAGTRIELTEGLESSH
jgi:hypothetical protein